MQQYDRIPILILIMIIGASLSACQLTLPTSDPLPPTPRTEESSANDPLVDQAGVATAEPTPTSEPEEQESTTVLSVWTAEDFAPSNDIPGGTELLTQLAVFDQSNPDIRVEVAVKRLRGAGGILDYLLSAPPVAPDILPDIVLLDRDALLQAAHEGLIVPLAELPGPAAWSEVYPVATLLGTVDGVAVGVPYLLEMQHTIYRDTFFEEPPTNYEVILDAQNQFVFSAGTPGIVDSTTLTQYFAAGGTLIDEEGNPALDIDALRKVLTFYADARGAQALDPAIFQITSPADSWSLYTTRQTNFAVVTSTLYLSGRDELRNTSVAPIPNQEGSPHTLVTGWSWAIVTDDPDRQAAALALLDFLMEPANQGDYSQALGWLPSRRSSLTVWGDSDPYASFSNILLNNADLLPDPDQLGVVGAAIQQAFEDVLLENILPVQAVNSAAEQVNDSINESP